MTDERLALAIENFWENSPFSPDDIGPPHNEGDPCPCCGSPEALRCDEDPAVGEPYLWCSVCEVFDLDPYDAEPSLEWFTRLRARIIAEYEESLAERYISEREYLP